MAEDTAELEELVRTVAAAASAYIAGDMRRYVELIDHADDYTLMPPYGGDTWRGFDSSPEALDATARLFHGGEARLQVDATYASGDLAVLVAVERQHGEVGDLPDQDYSLRVTLVFRRRGPSWQLVHRHADPLTRRISYDALARLTRGEA